MGVADPGVSSHDHELPRSLVGPNGKKAQFQVEPNQGMMPLLGRKGPKHQAYSGQRNTHGMQSPRMDQQLLTASRLSCTGVVFY